ncbi:MAG: hypothetical protein AAGK67_11220 [Pseudomonadota bacterium]
MTTTSAIRAMLPALLLFGCTQFPDLEDSFSKEALSSNFPRLEPVEELRSKIREAQITDASLADTEARIDNLKARAARLRGTVIDQNSRNRLSQQPAVVPTN